MKIQVILAICTAVFTLASCESKQSVGQQDSIWFRPLTKVDFKDVPIARAVEELVAIYRKQYPNDQRLSGYLVAAEEAGGSRVTMDLKDVPLGEACQLLATSSGWKYSLHERTLCLFPGGQGNYKASTEVLSFSSQVRSSLRLGNTPSEGDVVSQLKELKIQTTEFDSVRLFEKDGNQYLIVSGTREELDTLHHLWKLLERGLAMDRE